MSARFKDYTCPFNSDKSFSINNQLWPRGEIVNLECSKMVEAMLKFYNSFMSVFIKSVNINSVFPSWRSLSRFSHPVYQFPWKCLQLRRKFRFFLVLVQNSINVQNWWFCFDLIKGCNQISKSLLFFVSGHGYFKQRRTSRECYTLNIGGILRIFWREQYCETSLFVSIWICIVSIRDLHKLMSAKPTIIVTVKRVSNRLLLVFLLMLVIQPQACNFIKKETLVQVFSCEFYEISKNTFFHRTPLVAASER